MSKDFVSIEKQLKKFYLLTNDFNKNVFIFPKMHNALVKSIYITSIDFNTFKNNTLKSKVSFSKKL